MHGKNELYNIFHHSIALITHKFKDYLDPVYMEWGTPV